MHLNPAGKLLGLTHPRGSRQRATVVPDMRMDAGRPPSSAFGFEWVYSWRGSPRTRVPNVLGWAGHPGRKGARPTSKGGPNRSDVIQSSGHAHSMFRLRWAVLVLADVGYAMPCPHGTEPPVLGAFTTLTLAPPNGPSLFRWWVTPRTPADPVQRRGGRTPAAAPVSSRRSRATLLLSSKAGGCREVATVRRSGGCGRRVSRQRTDHPQQRHPMHVMVLRRAEGDWTIGSS